ncbi:hypothetical protein GFY24_00855 [Nocardia sp. SYP-A9097]|uniref:hypothetical protein n=1 Tax=Nocardia sp. SYP-A9097 TaxID=2663237 RepID=UPI00129BBBB3|nr:hypothetical protein [Nocardia sp. SYP-A9097]MRH86027.1 hypothetical protein [Nocardia sp. SYP-A9097]
MVKAGKQGARRLASAATRREYALEMFLAGKTYQQIADALDYCDRGSAHRAVQGALAESAERTTELADQARPIILARLDRLWGPWFKKARGGDPKAADICLRMVDRYSKLHGLDRIQIDATVTSRSEIDAEIEELMTKLRATPAAAPNPQPQPEENHHVR